MYLGCKGHYAELQYVLNLVKNFEFHLNYSDFHSNWYEVIDGLFSTVKPDHLAFHIPLITPSGDISCGSVSRELYLEILSEMMNFNDFLSKFTKNPVMQVIHSPEYGFKSKEESFDFVLDHFESRGTFAVENFPKIATRFFGDLSTFSKFLDKAPKNVGMTLDVSHYHMVFEPRPKNELKDFINSYGDKVFHLHLSDVIFSDPKNSEGTQIGEGNIDWNELLDVLSPVNAMAVPEIKTGHLNKSAGFKQALKILRQKGLK